MKKLRVMHRKVIMAAALGFILSVSGVQAIIVVDFEGIPDEYLYFGGGQNLGDYYSDLYFGPDVTVFDKVRYGYNDAVFPPHSGDAVVGSAEIDYVRVDFIGFTPDYVEAWYTSCETFYMEAYDELDNLIGSSTGPSNCGSNSLISVSCPDISYVKFHDSGEQFGLDDFAYTPEPMTVILLGLGGLAAIRRHKKQ